MYERLFDLAGRQHGLLTRRQALDAGLSSRDIATRVAPGGGWRRVLAGVYVVIAGPVSPVQYEQAALLFLGPVAMLTGASACQHHGLGFAVDDGRVHVAAPHNRRRRPAEWVCVHRTTRGDEAVATSAGLPLASCARAVVDYGLESYDLGDVRAVTCESVQSRRTTVEALEQALDDAPQQQSALIRRAIGDVAAGVRSAPEAELRDIFMWARLPEAHYNVDVFAADGSWLATPDVVWEELHVIVEVDSVEFHYLTAEQQRATEARRARLRRHGYTVISVTPRDIRRNPHGVLMLVLSTLQQAAAWAA